MRNALVMAGFLLAGPLFSANPLLIENEQVRVLRAATVPGQKSQMHVHLINRVMVHLDRGTMQLAYENGSVKDVPFQAGQIRWDPKVGLHTSENVGGTAYRIIEIEMKTAEGVAKGTLPAAPKALAKELENSQVRILRVKPEAQGAARDFVFKLAAVAVRLSDGETSWQAAGSKGLAGVPKDTAEWILVEIK